MAATMAAVFTRSWPITGEHCRHVTRRRALIGHLGVVPPQPRHLPGCERRHDRGRGAAAEPGEEAAQPAQQHQPALPLEGEALAAFINYVILPILVANVLSMQVKTRSRDI